MTAVSCPWIFDAYADLATAPVLTGTGEPLAEVVCPDCHLLYNSHLVRCPDCDS